MDKIRSSIEDGGRYRLLVEAVTDYAIYMLDPSGVVSSWNAGAERFKGYTAEEILGQHFSRFYTDEDRQAGVPAKALEISAKTGKFETEGWRVRRDGTRFWAHVLIDPIRAPDGTVLGFAKVTRDLTERKTAQIALEKAREALFQSQKMEAVGQLTGGVAHDFNNLLMAILGSLELLRKRMPDDEHMLRLLDNAILGARRGTSLTQRMLAFARRQELKPHPLDLAELVRGMTDLLRRSLGTSAEIETQFPLALNKVMADGNQLELALLNLTVNARDASPDGTAIVISAREQRVGEGHETGLPPGQYVRLAVTDTGEGMSEETLARATEPFFTTKGVGKGTGLGLSMVHGMIEQVGGRFLLKSKLGVGTTAEIWLPVATEQVRAEQPTVLHAAEAPVMRSLRVLAVDDDGLVLFNTVAMLEDIGHTVSEATSGSAALKLLRKHPFDLVITDQAMPKMTGLQLLNAIKAEWPQVPVIIATGYAELPSSEVKVPKLNKPFTSKDLVSIITQVAPVERRWNAN